MTFTHVVGLLLVLIAVVAAAIWLTARRVQRQEERRRSDERIADLTAMTGGLAHEIKNPLSTVNLNLQLLQEDLRDLHRNLEPGDEDWRTTDRLDRIQRRVASLGREAGRLRSILEDFLSFAGRIKLSIQSTDLNELISELGDFFAPQAELSGLHLRLQLAARPPDAQIDPDLIKQAVLNLMINAVRATEQARKAGKPHGGGDELIIRTERKGIAPQSGRRKQSAEEQLLIHVIDTGPGIAPDVLGSIFQPYYSTLKGGTGLGLPIARRIVEEHGGRLEVFSELGRGSDFTIVLPAISPHGLDQDTGREGTERGDSGR
ncbi:MAG: hypothetical protein JJU36_10035 [Phycisphaeraceae bacterium]|nr:hypothetical protein [Phycisphaeraceae bacterium]